MRKNMWFSVVLALFIIPAGVSAQQQGQQGQQGQAQQSSASSAQSAAQSEAQSSAQIAQTPPVQEDSLAAAARRAREQKKDQPKSAKIITNDNIPNQGGISSVGANPLGADAASTDSAVASNSGAGTPSGSDEKKWREKFANLRHKLDQDQQELSVMERELGVLDVQYYNDPVKAMQQDLTRSDINKKTADIDAKKQQIEADKQAISDAEDDLRKAGGDSGWSR